MTDIRNAPESSLQRQNRRMPVIADPGDVGLAPRDQEVAATCANALEIIASRSPDRCRAPDDRRFDDAASGIIHPATITAALRGALQEEGESDQGRAHIVTAFGLPPLPFIETRIDLVTTVLDLRATDGGSCAAKALATALPPLTGGDTRRIGDVGGLFARRIPDASRRAAAVAELAPTEACR